MNNRFKKFLSLIFFFVLLFSIKNYSQTVQELISQGDNLAQKDFNNQGALEKFQQADKLSPNNWEVLWRLSRTWVDIAEHLPSNTSEQKDVQLEKYKIALDYADKAVKLAGDKSVCYLRRAIANGRIALFKGVFTVGGVVNSVKQDVEKAISLGNGGNDIQATCHYVLGRTHAKLCEKPKVLRWPIGLAWGNMETAIDEFNTAIKMRPNFRMYHIDIAKAYIEEDEYQKAKEHLYKIPNISIADEDDDDFLTESKQILEKIKNK